MRILLLPKCIRIEFCVENVSCDYIINDFFSFIEIELFRWFYKLFIDARNKFA